MNSKERVIKALEFLQPDRIPNGCYNLAAPPGQRADALKRLYERFPVDFAEAHGLARTLEWGPSWSKGIYQDEWGVVWKNLQDGVIGQPIHHPLAGWESFETYNFPNPLYDIENIQDSVRKADHTKYLLADGGSIWHRLHYLRGFQKILLDIVQRRKDLLLLINKLVEFNIERLKPILELDIDGVMFGDDWGTQQRLMIKLDQWQQYFKPAYKRMFDLVLRKGKHVFFHTDGYVIDILPDFIEMGVNTVNIQVSLIGIKNITSRFGGKICIAADVDRQHTMPFGSPSEVKNLVKDIIFGFKGHGGGLILFGEIGPDVSIENAESMLKALEDYGNVV